MATKSILKNIDIKNQKLGKSLIRALEKASGKTAKNVELSRMYRDIRGDDIKKVFGENQ